MRFRKTFAIGSVLCVAGMTGAASAATIAQYNFDSVTHSDATHTTAQDLGTGDHDVTWGSNLSLSTNNPFSQANNHSIAVSGTTGVADTTTTINLSANDTFTLEGWLNPSVLTAEAYVGYVSGSAGDPSYMRLGMNASGNAYAYFRAKYGTNPATTFEITGSGTLVRNGWNYLALTYDGSNLDLYVLNSNNVDLNNDPVLTTAGTMAIAGGKLTNNLNSVNFARASSGTITALFDDIRLSDTALSTSELGYHQSFSMVPEPASMAALALGGLLLMRRRRKA